MLKRSSLLPIRTQKGQPSKADLPQRPQQRPLLGEAYDNPITPQNYMKNVIQGAPVAATTPPTPAPVLALFRQSLLAVIIGSPLFTDAEQLRANHSAYECECPRRLVRWGKNVRRVAAERERAEGLAWMAAGIARFEAKLTGSTSYAA